MTRGLIHGSCIVMPIASANKIGMMAALRPSKRLRRLLMYKNILLPINLEDTASVARGLATAVEYARACDARLRMMIVVPDFVMSVVGSFFPDDFADKAIAETNKRLHAFVAENVPDGIAVHHVVAHGRIHEEIITQAVAVG
jgi:hypothetical protein